MMYPYTLYIPCLYLVLPKRGLSGYLTGRKQGPNRPQTDPGDCLTPFLPLSALCLTRLWYKGVLNDTYRTLKKNPRCVDFPKQTAGGCVEGWCARSGRKINPVILRYLKFFLLLYLLNICVDGKTPYLCTPQSEGMRVFIERLGK